MTRPALEIVAPLSGELVPLERVPDPVFSQKMVGDGVAIDPLDQVLRAPCAGEVIQLHPAGHAITVETAEGIQVLMHIGIDTIALKGQGFSPKVKKGDQVVTGMPLIEFDLDFIATHARSALTLVVVANSAEVAPFEPAGGMAKAGQDTIFRLSKKEGEAAEAGEGQRVTSQAVLIPNPGGLHARPAAVLANLAKTFRASIQLHCGGKEANARSMTAILALDAVQGAKVTLTARGPDAAEAIEKLSALLERGPAGHGGAEAAAPRAVAQPRWPHSDDPNLVFGMAASPGLGAGNVFQIRHGEISITEEAGDPSLERKLLDAAIGRAKAQLAALQAQMRTNGDAAIFAAHAELAEDPALMEVATSLIAKGKSAAFAWKQAFEAAAKVLAGMANLALAQRATDLRDVGERVLEILTGTERKKRDYPQHAILIAEELTPSDTVTLDRSRIKGFCTTRGGTTSHVAILAQSLGIPALAGMDPRALEVPNGTLAILDAGQGTLRLRPSLAEMEGILESQQADEVKYETHRTRAHEPAITLDGRRIEVTANIASFDDTQRIERLGGEGVGLLRTEFLFMERLTAPSEEEQFQTYKSIAEAVGPDRPLIIRTLDAGGDKPLACLPLPAEENPLLGERGIRIGLDRPEILRAQLRAILRASAFGKIQVIFPMIGTMKELREARAMLAEEAAALAIPAIPAGIMVEVPNAAVMARQFAKEADFFSIGTNDLTQYALAMDRTHPRFAPQLDGLTPGVLRLIEQTVAGAHARERRVGVCGGLGGDAQAVPILVGLGMDSLSVNLPAIPAVKAQIRALRLTDCRELAQRALDCDTAAEVRALVQGWSRGA